MLDPACNVLLVDDELATIELLAAVLARQGFTVTLATTPEAALRELRRSQFHAVVTDVVFDGSADGTSVLKATRDLQRSAVVILMTGYPVIESAVAAIKSGATDYLRKPVDPIVLGATLQRALREQHWHDETLGFTELVEIMSGMVANTIERIDPYTAGHGERTRSYCDRLASRMGLDLHTRERLQLAAIAHDYGKIYLDDLGFLTKKGSLTAAEYREVQRHPALGADKLGNHERLREVCQWIAEHHEKWDGTGYPSRKKREEISLPGRILGVVEVFDSLATRRSYKDAWGLGKLFDFFETQRGLAFDPEVLDEFLELLDQFGAQWLAPSESRQPLAARSIAV